MFQLLLLQLLNKISTYWGNLKKLARVLVGLDPELFPSPENISQPFKSQTAPEICGTAARLSRKPVKSSPFWDLDHVCTLVADCLAGFAFLNDPPTATVGVFPSVWYHLQTDSFEGGTTHQSYSWGTPSELLQRRRMAKVSPGQHQWRWRVGHFNHDHNGFICHNKCTYPALFEYLTPNVISSTATHLKNEHLGNLFRSHLKQTSTQRLMPQFMTTSQPSLITTQGQIRSPITSDHGQRRGMLMCWLSDHIH